VEDGGEKSKLASVRHLSLTKLDKELCHLEDKLRELLCGYLGIEIDIDCPVELLAQMAKEKNTGQWNW
jgi:hypothetical protein